MAVHVLSREGGRIVGVRSRVFRLALVAGAVVGVLGVLPKDAVGVVVGPGGVPAGTEFDVSSCMFGEDSVLPPTMKNYFGVESSSFQALQAVGVAPGGHFRFRGQYAHARSMTFNTHTSWLATSGFLGDREIQPDSGSVNPFEPRPQRNGGEHGKRDPRRLGHSSGVNTYTIDHRVAAPSDRPTPAPANVLYGGYSLMGQPSPWDYVMFRLRKPFPDQDPLESLPKTYWVVEDPLLNPFSSAEQVCAYHLTHVQRAALSAFDGAPGDPGLLAAPFEDKGGAEGPAGQPVAVWRPGAYGYMTQAADLSTSYIHVRPNHPLLWVPPPEGQFLVIRFKAPIFTPTEERRPITGREQTRFWSWCSYVSQASSAHCIDDSDFHVGTDGFVTLVASRAEDRPAINGQPFANWLPIPAAVLLWRFAGSDPVTFPASPQFLPLTHEDDPLDNSMDQAAIAEHMGPYFPDIRLCTSDRFNGSACAVEG